MKRLHILGVVLAGAVIVIERFGHPLPNWLAMALYGASVLLIIAGIIRGRRSS